MNVYFISGLGADKRAFKYLQLNPKLNVIYIDWLPAQPKESLKKYSERMAQSINTTEPFCLLGLSFGGIVANEISQILAPEKIIFLSTAKTTSELPWYFKVGGTLNLHKLLPAKFMFKQRNAIHKFFGAKSEKEKEILNEILNDSDPDFLTWAIDKIAKWKNNHIPFNNLHLHGSDDVIFPSKNIQNATIIDGGTHLMVLKKFRTISDAINQYLLNNEKE